MPFQANYQTYPLFKNGRFLTNINNTVNAEIEGWLTGEEKFAPADILNALKIIAEMCVILHPIADDSAKDNTSIEAAKKEIRSKLITDQIIDNNTNAVKDTVKDEAKFRDAVGKSLKLTDEELTRAKQVLDASFYYMWAYYRDPTVLLSWSSSERSALRGQPQLVAQYILEARKMYLMLVHHWIDESQKLVADKKLAVEDFSPLIEACKNLFNPDYLPTDTASIEKLRQEAFYNKRENKFESAIALYKKYIAAKQKAKSWDFSDIAAAVNFYLGLAQASLPTLDAEKTESYRAMAEEYLAKARTSDSPDLLAQLEIKVAVHDFHAYHWFANATSDVNSAQDYNQKSYAAIDKAVAFFKGEFKDSLPSPLKNFVAISLLSVTPKSEWKEKHFTAMREIGVSGGSLSEQQLALLRFYSIRKRVFESYHSILREGGNIFRLPPSVIELANVEKMALQSSKECAEQLDHFNVIKQFAGEEITHFLQPLLLCDPNNKDSQQQFIKAAFSDKDFKEDFISMMEANNPKAPKGAMRSSAEQQISKQDLRLFKETRRHFCTYAIRIRIYSALDNLAIDATLQALTKLENWYYKQDGDDFLIDRRRTELVRLIHLYDFVVYGLADGLDSSEIQKIQAGTIPELMNLTTKWLVRFFQSPNLNALDSFYILETPVILEAYLKLKKADNLAALLPQIEQKIKGLENVRDLEFSLIRESISAIPDDLLVVLGSVAYRYLQKPEQCQDLIPVVSKCFDTLFEAFQKYGQSPEMQKYFAMKVWAFAFLTSKILHSDHFVRKGSIKEEEILLNNLRKLQKLYNGNSAIKKPLTLVEEYEKSEACDSIHKRKLLVLDFDKTVYGLNAKGDKLVVYSPNILKYLLAEAAKDPAITVVFESAKQTNASMSKILSDIGVPKTTLANLNFKGQDYFNSNEQSVLLQNEKYKSELYQNGKNGKLIFTDNEMNKLGIRPQDAIWVEDDDNVVWQAMKYGMVPILVPHYQASDADIFPIGFSFLAVALFVLKSENPQVRFELAKSLNAIYQNPKYQPLYSLQNGQPNGDAHNAINQCYRDYLTNLISAFTKTPNKDFYARIQPLLHNLHEDMKTSPVTFEKAHIAKMCLVMEEAAARISDNKPDFAKASYQRKADYLLTLADILLNNKTDKNLLSQLHDEVDFSALRKMILANINESPKVGVAMLKETAEKLLEASNIAQENMGTANKLFAKFFG